MKTILSLESIERVIGVEFAIEFVPNNEIIGETIVSIDHWFSFGQYLCHSIYVSIFGPKLYICSILTVKLFGIDYNFREYFEFMKILKLDEIEKS